MRQQALDCFNIYKESLFKIDHDLRFWKHFLKLSINNAQSQEDREINKAIFCAYDHPFDRIGGILKCHEKVYMIKTSELEQKRIDFFIWIMNLSLLKAYNALEILLLQAIQIIYFPKLSDPIKGKKYSELLQKQIKEFLKQYSFKVNTKNNEYLVQFIRYKSSKIDTFFNLPMNVDLSTKWVDFFYLISILRNIVAHCEFVVQTDLLNEIKSRAKDIFERHFEIIKNENDLPILTPRGEIFGDFIKYINSLSINIYKFVFNEDNLSFLELK